MPPKRAKTAAKVAPAQAAPKTRTTRSRTTAKDSPVDDTLEEEAATKTVKPSSKRTRNRTSAAEDVSALSYGQDDGNTRSTRTRRVTAQTDDGNGSAAVEELKTAQKPSLRGRRPPRTVKKPVRSEANKAALEGLKKRMEEDARRLKDGDADVSAPAVTEAAIQEEAEKNVSAAAEVEAAPGLPPTNISPPTKRTRAVSTTFQRRAPGTIQRGAPGTAQKAAPGTIARPQSSVKVQSTPGVENSVLALANFRRRARQPSLLSMVQNPELAKDLGNDSTEFNTDFTLGASDDEEAEFAPYDESTPLQVSKGLLPSVQQTRSTMGTPVPAPTTTVVAENDTDSLYNATPLPSPHPKSSRKRKSDAMEEEADRLPLSEIQIPRSQLSPSARHSSRLRSSCSISASPDPDDTIPATAPSRTMTPSPRRSRVSSTYASPLSSSLIASPVSPTVPESAQRPRQASPSPTTNRRTGRVQTKSKPNPKTKVLTTATLRALLPKRRRQLVAADREREKERNEYDLSSSSLSLEDVSEEEVQPRRRGQKAKPKAKGALSPITNKKQPLRKTVLKQVQSEKQAAKKTYSRAAVVTITSASASSSDKENHSDNILARGESSELSELESAAAAASSPPDTSIETIKGGGEVGDISKELKERKRFFEEVDEWDMEFESMSGGGVGSSPAWR